MSTYGRACLQCTKAKVRCASNSDQGPCERCTRLRKECQPAPRTRATKGKTRSDRHTALEAKVDSLVELLKRNQAIPDEGLSGHDVGARAQCRACEPGVVTSPLFSLTMQASSELQSDGEPSSTSHAPGTSVASSAASSTTTPPAASASELPPETEEELQDILDTYREKMFQFFPVVSLGTEVTVEYMVTQRPFVWLVLRTICSKKLVRQLALATVTKQTVAQKLVVEGERSFDMLVGLVLYCNWGQFFCLKANLSPALNLALSLAGDLGLTKSAPQGSPAIMLNWTPQGCPKPPHALVLKPRTIEERRVVLGLFLVSSIVGNFFQRSEPMRWTAYLEECLNLLQQTKEHPTDELLVYLIRVQLICNGIVADGWSDVYHITNTSQKLPRLHYMHLHKMQLDEVKRSMPDHLKINPVLKFHMLGTEISLFEHHLTPSASPITSVVDQSHRVEGLWACFTTVKAYCDSFFDMNTFPLLTYLYVSMGVYTHLGHCIVALFRLSTFESPDIPWDRQKIISLLDLGDIIKGWVQVFDSAPEAAGIDLTGAGGSESQWDYSKKILLTTILKWWESKVRPSIMEQGAEQRDAAVQPQQQPSAAGEFEAMSAAADFGDMDFSFENDTWMRDMINGGFDFGGF